MGYRCYDHRIKEIVIKYQNPYLFPKLDIPLSTAKSWITKGIADIVTLPELNLQKTELVVENQKLRSLVEETKTEKKLILFTFRVFGFQIQYKRLPTGDSKKMILAAIRVASKKLSIKKCLEVIDLSVARFRSWEKREKGCQLQDQSSCPKSSPSRLLPTEIQKIREYVTSKDFSHFTIFGLSWHARRQGEVFVSPSTWSRVIKKYVLRRPKKRVYPAKPKVGVRADKPNQIWHMDVSILKMMTGEKIYIQCIVDNFSRFIIACEASLGYGGAFSKTLLQTAIDRANKFQDKVFPEVYVDKGTENVNNEVDSLVSENLFRRIIAKLDVEFSNSLVEMIFRSMKHNFLFFNELTNYNTSNRLIQKYVYDHNEIIPHSALKGATPFEIYAGLWGKEQIEYLSNQNRKALAMRIKLNRTAECNICKIG